MSMKMLTSKPDHEQQMKLAEQIMQEDREILRALASRSDAPVKSRLDELDSTLRAHKPD